MGFVPQLKESWMREQQKKIARLIGLHKFRIVLLFGSRFYSHHISNIVSAQHCNTLPNSFFLWHSPRTSEILIVRFFNGITTIWNFFARFYVYTKNTIFSQWNKINRFMRFTINANTKMSAKQTVNPFLVKWKPALWIGVITGNVTMKL